MIRKQHQSFDSDPRAETRKVLASTGSLVINHEEEVIESEAGIFEKFASWDKETVARFRDYFARNGAAVSFFEQPLGSIRDRQKRRFEAISAAVAHFAAYYENRKRSGGMGSSQNGMFARWECTFVA
jgi:hypothetical protein